MKNKTVIFLCLLMTFNCFVSYVSFSYEKPSYEDYIRSQYDKELTDKQVEQIKKREKFAKALQELPENFRKDFFDSTNSVEDENGNQRSNKNNLDEAKEKKDEIDDKKNKVQKQESIELMYGTFSEFYGGVNNYKRKNFLLMLYSLRDIDVKDGKQPILTSGNYNNNYRKLGFDIHLWQNKNSTLNAHEIIKWSMYQFEPTKLFSNPEVNMISKLIYENDIKDYITSKGNNIIYKLDAENRQLFNCTPGDILLYVENNKIKDYGIYVGKDEEKDYYALASHKNINNIDLNDNKIYNYMTEVLALSYINSTKVYPQEINGKINLITGTNYNYVIKMDFIK